MGDIIPQPFHDLVNFFFRSLFGDCYQKLTFVSEPVEPYRGCSKNPKRKTKKNS